MAQLPLSSRPLFSYRRRARGNAADRGLPISPMVPPQPRIEFRARCVIYLTVAQAAFGSEGRDGVHAAFQRGPIPATCPIGADILPTPTMAW